MTARGARVALGGLAVAAVVALLAAGLVLASASRDTAMPLYVSETVSKRAARLDVHRRGASLDLPPWGKRVSRHSPFTSSRLRGHYPVYGPADPHPVWHTSFLSFRGGPRQTVRWFLDHPPPGSKLYDRSAGPRSDHRWYRCLWFEWPDGRPVFGERNMVMCATTAHGQTSMRVDTEATWLEGRSPYERIPAGSRYMEVILAKPGEDPRRSLVTDVARIDRIVDLVNRLPIVQRYSCAPSVEDFGNLPRVQVVFRSTRKGWPIAQVSRELVGKSQCPPLQFSLRGRPERGLDQGWLVLRELHARIERLRRIRVTT
jgi:hypothetical protein